MFISRNCRTNFYRTKGWTIVFFNSHSSYWGTFYSMLERTWTYTVALSSCFLCFVVLCLWFCVCVSESGTPEHKSESSLGSTAADWQINQSGSLWEQDERQTAQDSQGSVQSRIDGFNLHDRLTESLSVSFSGNNQSLKTTDLCQHFERVLYHVQPGAVKLKKTFWSSLFIPKSNPIFLVWFKVKH